MARGLTGREASHADRDTSFSDLLAPRESARRQQITGYLQAPRLRWVTAPIKSWTVRAVLRLDDLDKELEKHAQRFVRYADDFIVLVKSRQAGEQVMENLKRFLERSPKPRINKDKTG